MYMRVTAKQKSFLLLYVDEIILARNVVTEMCRHYIKNILENEFSMTYLGDLNYS